MPATVTVSGSDVLSGRISLPLHRRWVAQLRVDAASALAGAVTITCEDGLQLAGAVVQARVAQDACEAWIVGGAGGLATPVAGSFQRAQLRDPLSAVARAAGETLDDSITDAVLGLEIDRWSTSGPASAALDALAAAAAERLRVDVHWRFLENGRLWIGQEAWPATSLPDHADVLADRAAIGAVVIGTATPTLLPGVEIDGVGRALGVEHFLASPSGIRTWVHL